MAMVAIMGTAYGGPQGTAVSGPALDPTAYATGTTKATADDWWGVGSTYAYTNFITTATGSLGTAESNGLATSTQLDDGTYSKPTNAGFVPNSGVANAGFKANAESIGAAYTTGGATSDVEQVDTANRGSIWAPGIAESKSINNAYSLAGPTANNYIASSYVSGTADAFDPVYTETGGIELTDAVYDGNAKATGTGTYFSYSGGNHANPLEQAWSNVDASAISYNDGYTFNANVYETKMTTLTDAGHAKATGIAKSQSNNDGVRSDAISTHSAEATGNNPIAVTNSVVTTMTHSYSSEATSGGSSAASAS